MIFKLKWALALVPMLALALPALAQTRDLRLADNDEPGSVLVFPKFINAAPVSVDGVLLPRTEIEIGVVNPPNTGVVLAEHSTIEVRLHWVCPGTQDFATLFVCRETDFDIFLSINGKLAFSADGSPLNANTPVVPAAPCPNGYLIAWVINNTDQPIKFDGLIGDAVIRGMSLAAGPNAGSSTAVEAYRAIAIQADPALATGALIATDTDPATGTASLVFDGTPGHYQAIAGTLYGDIKFDRTTAGGGPAPVNALSKTFLILLTLDVRSNRPNNPTMVPLDFYNESLATVSPLNPLFEALISSSVEFLCWGQFNLSDPVNGIDVNLTQVFQNTRKGIVIAGPAEGDQFIGINDPPFTPGDARRTLIGMVQTNEGTSANLFQERGYIFQMHNNSAPIPTRFVPSPF
jgi:hypothetical protein